MKKFTVFAGSDSIVLVNLTEWSVYEFFNPRKLE